MSSSAEVKLGLIGSVADGDLHASRGRSSSGARPICSSRFVRASPIRAVPAQRGIDESGTYSRRSLRGRSSGRSGTMSDLGLLRSVSSRAGCGSDSRYVRDFAGLRCRTRGRATRRDSDSRGARRGEGTCVRAAANGARYAPSRAMAPRVRSRSGESYTPTRVTHSIGPRHRLPSTTSSAGSVRRLVGRRTRLWKAHESGRPATSSTGR